MRPRINLLFRKVVEDMVNNREVDLTSRYHSLERSNTIGDFSFIVMEKFLSNDNKLPVWEPLIMKVHFFIKHHNLSGEKAFGLDTNNMVVEKFPLIVAPVASVNPKRAWSHGSS